MSDIRDKIITRFSLAVDSTDEQILLVLKKKLMKYHPDRASGEEEAKHNSSVFDEIKKLYDEFRDELKSQQTTEIVPLSEQDDKIIPVLKEQDAINEIIESKSIYDEKETLRGKLKSAQYKIDNLENENKDLKNQLSTKQNKDSEKRVEEIRRQFKGTKLTNGTGIVAFVGLLLTTSKNIRDFLDQTLKINSQLITIFLIVIFSLSFIIWVLHLLQNQKTNDLISKMSDPRWMELNVEIKERKVYSSIHHYVKQSDIRKAVENEINNSYMKHIYPFKKNAIIDLLTKHVISHYIDSQIMEISKSSDFERYFELNYEGETDSDKLPF